LKRSKTLIGGLCIAVAVVVGIGQWALVNVASTAAVPVVCAKMDIPAGTKITADMLEVRKMGKLNLPSNITGDTAKIVGAYATTNIQPEDIVTGGKLSGSAPAYALEDGQLLYSVTVKSLADSLSGKLQSGDIVRVVVPTQTTGNNNIAVSSDTIAALQYVRVEAVTASNGQSAGGNQSASSATTSSTQPATVTLIVNQQQVDALASLGSSEISFALVSRGDETKAKTLLEKQAALMGGISK
jgi:pilus assembly protein CpaB